MKKLLICTVIISIIIILLGRQFYSKVEVVFPWAGDPTLVLIPLSLDDTDAIKAILDKQAPRTVSTTGDAGILTQTFKLKYGSESFCKTAHRGVASFCIKKGEYLMMHYGGMHTITRVINARADVQVIIQNEDFHIWGEGSWRFGRAG